MKFTKIESKHNILLYKIFFNDFDYFSILEQSLRECTKKENSIMMTKFF